MNRRLAMLSIASALLVGCGEERVDGPPEVRFGQAECVHCGMIVSDARTAAAIVAEIDGKRRDLAFDDIGDMAAYEAEREDLRVVGRYVGDYATAQWVAVEEATLLRSDGLHTPMGSGVIGFADRAAAERKQAEVGGELLTYKELAGAADAHARD